MMWFPHGGMTSGWVWTIVACAWIAVAVVAYVIADRRATRSLPQDPVTVLDMQLARGDIDLHDYKARRQAIEGSR